jgi:hypothetical protein
MANTLENHDACDYRKTRLSVFGGFFAVLRFQLAAGGSLRRTLALATPDVQGGELRSPLP